VQGINTQKSRRLFSGCGCVRKACARTDVDDGRAAGLRVDCCGIERSTVGELLLRCSRAAHEWRVRDPALSSGPALQFEGPLGKQGERPY
jgi:hypothetical protein